MSRATKILDLLTKSKSKQTYAGAVAVLERCDGKVLEQLVIAATSTKSDDSHEDDNTYALTIAHLAIKVLKAHKTRDSQKTLHQLLDKNPAAVEATLHPMVRYNAKRFEDGKAQRPLGPQCIAINSRYMPLAEDGDLGDVWNGSFMPILDTSPVGQILNRSNNQTLASTAVRLHLMFDYIEECKSDRKNHTHGLTNIINILSLFVWTPFCPSHETPKPQTDSELAHYKQFMVDRFTGSAFSGGPTRERYAELTKKLTKPLTTTDVEIEALRAVLVKKPPGERYRAIGGCSTETKQHATSDDGNPSPQTAMIGAGHTAALHKR